MQQNLTLSRCAVGGSHRPAVANDSPRPEIAAFTFPELLVVLGVVALLALLLLPAVARTQSDSHAFQCQNNHRQLCRAWLMYAADNNEHLATSALEAAFFPVPTWASGWLDWAASPDNTNTLYLTDPRYSCLAVYCGKDARLFKCPADRYISSTQRVRGWKERTRSVSHNAYTAESYSASGPSDPSYFQAAKLTDLQNPKPAETWVSLDEHPDSINDGVLHPPNTTQLVDLPANYHEGGAGVAFADGRAEVHRWQASVLNVPVKFINLNNLPAPANDPDIQWLRYRTPRQPGAN